MKSPLGILVLALGAAAATVSFLLVSRLHSRPDAAPHIHSPSASPSGASSHSHAHTDADADLAWLATEFHLDAPAFERVRSLHSEYLPRCEALCRRIDDHNRRLKAALLVATNLNEQAVRLIEEGARVRAECQTALATHLIQVARCMPSDQGQRYLELMLPATGITAASHPISDFTHAKPHE